VVHLYFLSHNGLSYYYLYGARFLDEHEKIHEGSKTKSLVLFIIPLAITFKHGS